MVRTLLAHKANPQATDKHNRTALDYARNFKRFDTEAVLLHCIRASHVQTL
jgi:hypothetical protein